VSFVCLNSRNHFVQPLIRFGPVSNISDELLSSTDDAKGAILKLA
jgi:hypothetical protein